MPTARVDRDRQAGLGLIDAPGAHQPEGVLGEKGGIAPQLPARLLEVPQPLFELILTEQQIAQTRFQVGLGREAPQALLQGVHRLPEVLLRGLRVSEEREGRRLGVLAGQRGEQLFGSGWLTEREVEHRLLDQRPGPVLGELLRHVPSGQACRYTR